MDNYIAGIFVEQGSQSKGIGKSLIEYSKKIKDELMLNVYEKNERALQFYKRENFKILEKNRDENTNEIEFSMVWNKEK
ncbi:MAG: GNAT family N-acetyltransferase [Clostridium butyricum]|nr:GNAT family N-acetyltransferase [Clostridium butyricum]